MRDGYFYKSLCATLVLFFALLGFTTVFIFLTGPAGVFFMALLVLCFLGYFYRVFEKIRKRTWRKG